MIKILSLCALLFLCSCYENTTINHKLHTAESLMDERPDSALKLILSINPKQISKSSIKGKYSLLYSQALDKNFIDIESDSLISVAVNYYQRKGGIKEHFLSLYYLGRVQYNAKSYNDALISFSNAERLMYMINDPYLAGLLYCSVADLNMVQNSFERALHYYNKSYASYTLGENYKHRINILLHIAQSYILQGQYNNAITTYKRAMEEAKQRGYSDLQECCLRALSGAHCYIADTQAAISYMHQLMAIKSDYDIFDYCSFAQVYEHSNNADSMEYYAKKLIHVNDGDPEHIIAAKDMLSRSAFKKGDFQRAYKLSIDYQMLKDSLYLSHMNNSVAEAQLRYKDKSLAYERYRLKMKQQSIYMIIGVSILIVCSIIFIFRKRYKHQNERLSEYFALIDNMSESNNARNYRLTNLFNTRFKILKELAKTYYEYGNTISLGKKVKTILMGKIIDASVMKDLENTLNSEHHNVVEYFRKEYPRSHQDFIELLCLLYAGFSPQEICVITNESLSAIYMRKSRLKKKILISTIKSKNEILKITM